MDPMRVVLDDDVTRFQSDETQVLARKGRKVTKAELLDAFDKKAARVRAVEEQIVEEQEQRIHDNQISHEAQAETRAARRESRVLTQDVRDLEFCVEQLSDLCRHALRYHPTDYTESKLDEEIRSSVDTTRAVIAHRHQQSVPMEATDTHNGEPMEKRGH